MILVIDNYDSFTYNLVQYLGEAGAETKVWRNDEISLQGIQDLNPEGIMLSPGPCTPLESGVCLDVLGACLQGQITVPVFGVCLGMQAMGHKSGGTVGRAKAVRHGKSSPIEHDGKGLFAGMPNPFSAIRYHSLVVYRENLPPEFEISATSSDDHEIMGIRHRSLPIEGVQFHPESVLTESGHRIVENFVAWTRAHRNACSSDTV